MSDSSGKITTPISMTGDIKSVLGESATGFIALCQSTKVNMWSKVKPGSVSKQSYTSLLALCKAAKSNAKTSVYWTAPTKDYNMLTMWNGYNHNAVSPFQSWILGDTSSKVHKYGQDTTTAETAYFYYNSNAEVTVANIGLSGLYAGVAIADSNLTQVALITCASTWATAVTSGSGYMCAAQELNYGLFDDSNARLCFPVLSSVKAQNTSLSSDVSGTFYALPLAYKSITLTTVSASHKAYVTIKSAALDGSAITLKLVPHVDCTSGTKRQTDWSASSLPYVINIQYSSQYSHTWSNYSFPASSTGTWSDGNWTGADIELSLTAYTPVKGENYIMISMSSGVSYISNGMAAVTTV